MVKEAVIVAGARTAVGKAPRGALRTVRPDDMAAAVLTEVVRRGTETEGLDPAEIEDVVLGCAVPEGEQGFNVARIAALRAGLPASVAGQTVNRFCSSGLQTIAQSAERIMAGFGQCAIAGGTESMSMVQMASSRMAANPALAADWLDQLTGDLSDSPVLELRGMARTLRRWRTQILAWHTTGASNGPAEAVNMLIKKIKRVGHGFRKFSNYRLRVLLYTGGCNWSLLGQ